MALITSSVSSSFAETGSFGHLKITGDLDQDQHGTLFGTGSFGKIIANEVTIGPGTPAPLSAKTSGTSGVQGGTGAGGGTGGTGGAGGAGGTGAAGGTGGTGSKGNQGAQGPQGGQGAQGGTGGTGAGGGTGGTGSAGSKGAQGGQGGQGGTGGIGAQGGQGGTGGTGGTGGKGPQGPQGPQGGTGGTGGTGAKGSTGPQGPAGPQGPSGTSPYWTTNATLSWAGTKTIRGSGNYVYTTRIRNSGGNGWGLVVKSGATNVQLQNSAGSAIVQMYSNGNVTPSPMSDRRTKTNITPFPSHSISNSGSALSEIMKLDGLAKTFVANMEDTGSWPASLKATEPNPNLPWNTLTGYIAQDVMEITGSDGVSGSAHVNKFVQRIREDINDVLADDTETYFSFDYDGLASLKAQATIDLMKEVEGLKTRVQALEG